MTQQFN